MDLPPSLQAIGVYAYIFNCGFLDAEFSRAEISNSLSVKPHTVSNVISIINRIGPLIKYRETHTYKATHATSDAIAKNLGDGLRLKDLLRVSSELVENTEKFNRLKHNHVINKEAFR